MGIVIKGYSFLDLLKFTIGVIHLDGTNGSVVVSELVVNEGLRLLLFDETSVQRWIKSLALIS